MAKRDTIVKLGTATFTHFGACGSQKVQHELTNMRKSLDGVYIRHNLTVDFSGENELPSHAHISMEIRSRGRQTVGGVQVSEGGQEFLSAEYRFNRDDITMVLTRLDSNMLGHYENREFPDELVGDGKLFSATIPMSKDPEGRVVFEIKALHLNSEGQNMFIAVASPFAVKVDKAIIDLNLQPMLLTNWND